MIGLGGGELHHNGTHRRSLLNYRKDRVPNRNMRTIRRLCAAGSTRFDLGGQPAPDAEPGRLQPASSPIAAIRGCRIGLVSPSIAHATISLC